MPSACRSPHTLVIFAVILLLPVAAAAVTVDLVGEYSDVTQTDTGQPYGFTVVLWTHGDSHLGLLTYFAGVDGYSHASFLRHVQINRDTGAVVFRAKLFLGERRGRAIEVVEFVGSLDDNALTGDFTLVPSVEDRRVYFEHHAVTLPRLVSPDRPARFSSYSAWLAAHEGEIGTRTIARSAPEVTESPPRSLHIGLTGGIARTQGDGARLFNTTGAQAAAVVMYTFAGRVSVGVRAGIARWSPNFLRVREEVRPEGVDEFQLKVPENGYLIELSPVVRLSSGNAAADRAVVFAQASGGLYRVNFDTPYSIQWTEGGGKTKTRTSEIGYRGTYAGIAAGAGVSVRISESSRFELYPQYYRVFGADDELGFFGVMAQFRIEFLHD
jgi:hypothetical protein